MWKKFCQRDVAHKRNYDANGQNVLNPAVFTQFNGGEEEEYAGDDQG